MSVREEADLRSVVAVEDVTVVPMDSERRLPHQTVLVDGARITSITPVSQASVPSGAQRIDGRGRYLMPGLADMHCHPMAESHLLLFVAHGVTTVRNLHGMPRHLGWRERIGSGELVGPAIYTVGPIVGGRPSRRLWATSVSTRAEAVHAVAAIRRAGYDAVKVYDDLSADAYGWVVDAAFHHGLPVYGHIPWAVGLHGALRAGQRSIEHQYAFLEAMLPPGVAPSGMTEARSVIYDHADSFTDEGFQELAELTRASGTWNCPTVYYCKRWGQDDREIYQGPERRYLSPAAVQARRQYRTGTPGIQRSRRIYPLYLKAIKALSDAGAGLLTGTDAPVPGMLPGSSIHGELRSFTEAGLTPFQALRAATSDAARFLAAQDVWGVVREGARADLLLLDGDPLDDVANAAKIAGVMVAGHWHPAAELQQRLDQIADQVATEEQTPHRTPTLSPNGTPEPAAQTRRYEVEQAGHTMATEEVTITPHPTGGQIWRSCASTLTPSAEGALPGLVATTYRCEVHTDAEDIDQSATFESDGVDGHEQLQLTRDGDTLHITRTDSWSGEHTEVITAPDNTALSHPHAILWVQLCHRIDDLQPDTSRTVHFVGPGLPPGGHLYPSQVHVHRLADPTPTQRHYEFELHRPNFAARGTLTADNQGWPIEVKLSGTRTGSSFEAITQRTIAVN